MYKYIFSVSVLLIACFFMSCGEETLELSLMSIDDYNVNKSTPYMDAYFVLLKDKELAEDEWLPDNYSEEDFEEFNFKNEFDLGKGNVLEMTVRGHRHKTEKYMPSVTFVFKYPNGIPETVLNKTNQMTPSQFFQAVVNCLYNDGDAGCVRVIMDEAVNDCSESDGDCTHCWMFPECA